MTIVWKPYRTKYVFNPSVSNFFSPAVSSQSLYLVLKLTRHINMLIIYHHLPNGSCQLQSSTQVSTASQWLSALLRFRPGNSYISGIQGHFESITVTTQSCPVRSLEEDDSRYLFFPLCWVTEPLAHCCICEMCFPFSVCRWNKYISILKSFLFSLGFLMSPHGGDVYGRNKGQICWIRSDTVSRIVCSIM